MLFFYIIRIKIVVFRKSYEVFVEGVEFIGGVDDFVVGDG